MESLGDSESPKPDEYEHAIMSLVDFLFVERSREGLTPIWLGQIDRLGKNFKLRLNFHLQNLKFYTFMRSMLNKWFVLVD